MVRVTSVEFGEIDFVTYCESICPAPSFVVKATNSPSSLMTACANVGPNGNAVLNDRFRS